MDQRQDEPAFLAMLAGRQPEIQALATGARALIMEVMPGVVEVVWSGQGIAGYGTGPKKMSEHFCWIAPQTNHVNLGFNYGAELPDPEKLLEGTGRLFRHVKIRSAGNLQRPALRRLLEAASVHRVPPLKS